MNANGGVVTRSRGNLNENNEGNEADDGRHENESNNVQEGHVNTPNEDV